MKKQALALFVAVGSLFAGSIQFVDTLPVIKSEPVYKTVTKRTPYQECWDEQVPVAQDSSSSGTVGALIGGVAGGILGHQVGGGSGKTAATVGGAIVGTLVGKNLASKNSNSQTYSTRKRCVTKYNEIEEERFIGYKNIAEYKGKTITKITHEPRQIIRVIIKVIY